MSFALISTIISNGPVTMSADSTPSMDFISCPILLWEILLWFTVTRTNAFRGLPIFS
jgi:hypothetical protein